MSRVSIRTAALATLLTGFALQTAMAQSPVYSGGPQSAGRPIATYRQAPGRIASQVQARPIYYADESTTPSAQHPPMVAPQSYGYPQLSAPLYPSPRQDIPVQVGGTMITNPALAPHEMLYAHSYHAMYGPYYYKVKGAWIMTPFGMRSHDTWELQGTEVKVKYRDRFSILSGFVPPFVK